MANRPRAAIFDLDGTLVDNMAFHGRAWVATAERLGARATREQFERDWAGKKSSEIFAYLLGRTPSDEEAARLARKKEALYRELYRPHLAPLRGLRPFLDRLAAEGYRLALATAAPEENRALVIDGLGLRGIFAVVQGPEGVARGKPSPDIFLGAAAQLGLGGAECIAFEDAVNGLRAARAAGMEAVGVATSVGEAELREAGARFVLRDFERLPAELLELLFG